MATAKHPAPAYHPSHPLWAHYCEGNGIDAQNPRLAVFRNRDCFAKGYTVYLFTKDGGAIRECDEGQFGTRKAATEYVRHWYDVEPEQYEYVIPVCS